MSTSTLGFTLRLACTRADLREACAIRSQAYGHHLPEVGRRFAEPEALDHAEGTAVLLCRDKTSGQGIGTARIQSSRSGPLMLENSLILPAWLAGQPRAEITRLSVLGGADPLAKLCLMKASYLHCLASQVRWMVIGARNEALIRNYRRLGFRDVFGPDDRVPLAHAGGLPHRMLAFDVNAAYGHWQRDGHALFAFMVETFHPDLQLIESPLAQRQAPNPAMAQALRLVAAA